MLLINLLLKALGRPDKLLPFIVPFLWIENLQQLLGGIVQSLTVMTGDQTLMISILPVAVWTCYWLWRDWPRYRRQGGLGGGRVHRPVIHDRCQPSLYASVATASHRRIINANKIQALGRGGRASGAAVTGGKRGFHIIGVPFTRADKRQRSGDIAHLVMQE